jgi:putative FmdB family regulatory protein
MTYEYRCTACTHTWEAEQRLTDKPLTTCPSCKAQAAKRLIGSRVSFRLSGGCWAKDGYGKGGGQ